MKYRYRNVKTGETVTTSNRVSGKNWELVDEPDILHSADTDIEDDVPDEEVHGKELTEDDIPDEEPTVDEVPEEKPKTTRRGKK